MNKIKAVLNTGKAIMRMIRSLHNALHLVHEDPTNDIVCVDIPESQFFNLAVNRFTGERTVVGFRDKDNNLHIFDDVTDAFPFLTEEEIKKRAKLYL